jgi:DNA-binding NarL/FixJ family response regulator
VLAAIETVAGGGVAGCPPAMPAVIASLREGPQVAAAREPDIALPSERDREVLRLVVEGLDNTEIAEALNLSLGTVKSQVSGLLERLGVENRVQLAVDAVRRGIV